MKILSRREALGIGLGALALFACSSDDGAGTDDAGTRNDGSPQADGGGAWIVPSTLYFVAGSNATFDLKTTLPSGTATGGTFAVDGSGSPLPQGLTLSADGVLTLTSAAVGETAGVVFSYTT